MQILVCNDDGVESPLIKILADKLRKYGTVLVCCPDGERSASSQAITFREHYVSNLKDLGVIDGVRYMSHPHFPTDSLRYVLHFTNFKPDLVVSGINKGLNVGIDVYYSGTVGIVTEALVQGIEGFAISIDRNYKDEDLKFLDSIIDKIIKEHLYSKDYILNVNLPIGQDKLMYKVSSLGIDNGKDSDILAIKDGFVTFTPLVVNRTDNKGLKLLKTKI